METWICNKLTWDITIIKVKYKKYEKVPRHSSRIAINRVLHCKDFEIRGAIVRFAKINAMLKRSANRLFPIENTYQDTKQAEKEKTWMLTAWTLDITNLNLLIRFTKSREIFPSVTRVLSILQTTTATRASVEREKIKKRVDE